MKRRFLCLVLLSATWACHSDRNGNQFVSPQPLPQDPMETIARYEDARTDGDGLLQALLRKGDARTRERAAVALGRLAPAEFGTAVTEGLVLALSDESPNVRAAAAFALGGRADPSATGALLAHWNDPDPRVRARIVEAGSRIDDTRLRAAVVASLDDPDASVRSEAVLGPLRFPAVRPDTSEVDAAILDFLARPAAGSKPAPDAEARWRGMFTLSRSDKPHVRAIVERMRNAYVAGLSSSDVRERIFAAKGLAGIPCDEVTVKALSSAIEDTDWRVACEAAVALGRKPCVEAFPALSRAAAHNSPHVRRAAMSALGAFVVTDPAKDDAQPAQQSAQLAQRNEQFAQLKPRVAALLASARDDASAEVRTAALESEATVLGAQSRERIAAAAKSQDPLARAAAASAASRLGSEMAVPLLVDLTRDPDLRVAGIAIEGLQKHPGAQVRTRLVELMSSPDNGLRLAAVTSLHKGKMLIEGDASMLLGCLRSSSGEISAELAAAIVEASDAVTGNSVLLAALDHPDAHVRTLARAKMKSGTQPLTVPPDVRGQARLAAVVVPDKDQPAGTPNPQVVVKTNRGSMTFVLFPAEAPNHVRNFLELAAQHHYDGLTFHRVELDFVIQGGDHRGDGNGGVTWRGEPLRAEFTPRKFVRGSLGMPRNDDPDSGGSQFFVTHRETPHLDGRYTIFGELVSGFDTLDAIEVGDTIESVRVVPAR